MPHGRHHGRRHPRLRGPQHDCGEFASGIVMQPNSHSYQPKHKYGLGHGRHRHPHMQLAVALSAEFPPSRVLLGEGVPSYTAGLPVSQQHCTVLHCTLKP